MYAFSKICSVGPRFYLALPIQRTPGRGKYEYLVKHTFEALAGTVKKYARSNHRTELPEHVAWVTKSVAVFYGDCEFQDVPTKVRRNGIDLEGDVHEIERGVEVLREVIKGALKVYVQLLRIRQHPRPALRTKRLETPPLKDLVQLFDLLVDLHVPALDRNTYDRDGRVITLQQVVHILDSFPLCPPVFGQSPIF